MPTKAWILKSGEETYSNVPFEVHYIIILGGKSVTLKGVSLKGAFKKACKCWWKEFGRKAWVSIVSSKIRGESVYNLSCKDLYGKKCPQGTS